MLVRSQKTYGSPEKKGVHLMIIGDDSLVIRTRYGEPQVFPATDAGYHDCLAAVKDYNMRDLIVSDNGTDTIKRLRGYFPHEKINEPLDAGYHDR